MRKIFYLIIMVLLGLTISAPAQNKKFRTDSLRVTTFLRVEGRANIDTVSGDGSLLTGIVGSVGESAGDLILGADNDSSLAGEIIFKVRKNEFLRILQSGQGWFTKKVLVVGDANSGSPAGFSDGIQLHSDTTASIIAARIYGGGSGARYAFIQASDFYDEIQVGSSKTGTVPGDTAWPLVFFIAGPGKVGRFDTDGKFSIGEPSSVGGYLHVNGTALTNGGIRITTPTSGSTASDGGYIYMDGVNGMVIFNQENSYLALGANNTVVALLAEGKMSVNQALGDSTFSVGGSIEADYILSKNFVEIAGAAWFATTNDTVAGIIPAVSFRQTGEDTAYYDMGVFPHGVAIDSLHLEITTTLTSGDSARFVLGQRQIDFTGAYYGAFTTQSSSYVDLGGTANVRSKLSCTTAIALTGNRRLILRLHRDNEISNNAGGKVKLVSVLVFGKGLR